MALIGHLAHFLLALRLGRDRWLDIGKARVRKQEASLPVDENQVLGSKMIQVSEEHKDN